MIITINEEEFPERIYHVGYRIREKGGYIILDEIVECYYIHPESKDHALIPKIEVRERRKFLRNQEKAAPLFLLKHAINNIHLMFED